MTNSNYNILIQKLDAFVRKYYKNELLRGGSYFVALVLALFIIVVTLEHFGRYGSVVRAALFYLFLGSTMYLLVRFLLIPLGKLLRIGKTLSYQEASAIIGKHFPDVKDKLLNTLQLQQTAVTVSDTSLIEAAIEQKIRELKPIPFTSAINLRNNLRYARYVLLPLLVMGIVYLIVPGMISEASKRVIKYDETFVEPAPFSFEIQNGNLEAEPYTDYTLEVELVGREIPNEVFIVKNGNAFKMQKTSSTHFSYVINSIKEAIQFKFEAAGFFSKTYEIALLAKPKLMQYHVFVDYPSYVNKPDETLNNPGDMHVPAGTLLKWKFTTKQTDNMLLRFGKAADLKATLGQSNQFTYEKKMFLSSSYQVRIENKQSALRDSLQYHITVLPDAFPAITVNEKTDTLSDKLRYFMGDVSDDYGLSKLTFNYRFAKSDNENKVKQGLQKQVVPITVVGRSARFYHQLLLEEIGVEPSDEVVYYFEVWDNDGVHGPKSSKSELMYAKAPSLKELEQKGNAQSNAMKNKMEEAVKEAQSMQKELKSLEQKMHDKRELTWEEKKKLEQLIERQKQLNSKIEEIKNEQKQLGKQEQEYQKQSAELMKKQQQLNKLFNEVMNDEMKKLLKQLEQMMQQQNKDQIKQEMDKMQLSNKDVEKELDRMLEQYKQLEVEKKLEDAVKKLDELSQKQKELAQKSEQLANDKKLNKEEKQQQLEKIKNEQQKNNEEFKAIEKQLKDIEQKNAELETPKQLEKTADDQQEIEEKQQQSQEDLDNKQPEKAAQKQKDASGKMKEMSDKMKKNMESEEEKEMEINEESLREILENTIQLSKDQEQLMEDFKQVNNYNPQYVEMAKQQKNIRDNARIIEDSLLALSKRVPEISSYINKEVSKLNDNLSKSIEGFGSRNIGQIRVNQQSAMMNANNLGVMLSEVLKQMQQEMSGNGKSANKPQKGKGKGQGKGKSMSSLKKMQEELNKQLREGLNKQEGKGNKPGEKPGGMSSEEYARMAAQQMAIRQQMQKMMSEMGAKEKEELGGNAKLQELQKQMEQTEKELFNKQLSSQMLQRQEEIMTRMLESEKAERKQEEDKKREAEQAKEKPRPAPPSFEPYIRQKQKEQELLETIPAEMQPYYKEKAKAYFNKTGK